MFTILNGGKTNGSQVRFTKFYLIVDPERGNGDLNLIDGFNKFISAFKKNMGAIKGGETAFKPNADGSYFNAFSSINDTFKYLEDAINQSGINDASEGQPKEEKTSSKQS